MGRLEDAGPGMTAPLPDWRKRVLALAIRRRDLAARAILEGGRTWTPEPVAPPMFVAPVGRWAA